MLKIRYLFIRVYTLKLFPHSSLKYQGLCCHNMRKKSCKKWMNFQILWINSAPNRPSRNSKKLASWQLSFREHSFWVLWIWWVRLVLPICMPEWGYFQQEFCKKYQNGGRMTWTRIKHWQPADCSKAQIRTHRTYPVLREWDGALHSFYKPTSLFAASSWCGLSCWCWEIGLTLPILTTSKSVTST